MQRISRKTDALIARPVVNVSSKFGRASSEFGRASSEFGSASSKVGVVYGRLSALFATLKLLSRHDGDATSYDANLGIQNEARQKFRSGHDEWRPAWLREALEMRHDVAGAEYFVV